MDVQHSFARLIPANLAQPREAGGNSAPLEHLALANGALPPESTRSVDDLEHLEGGGLEGANHYRRC